MGAIKFGTDGWRAKIAEEFTFENLGKVTRAYAAAVLQVSKKPKIALGYDNRFLSEKYAAFAADILAKYGFTVYLFDGPVPTPMVSWAIVRKKLESGIMITSSHNPYTYNGFKIKNRFGAGATKEETQKVEEFVVKQPRLKEKAGSIIKINLDDQYVAAVQSMVDINAIKKSGMKIVMDAMYGSGAGYMEKVLGNYSNLTTIHGYRDPLFGGINPEPIRQNLLELEEAVKQTKADIGIAIDGDGDRMAFVDDKGRYIPTHKALVFHMLHHIKNKKMHFKFIKTISGTSLLDRIAEEYKIKIIETPVGFKYIGDHIIRDTNSIGGEESGGVGFGYYIPERDGIVGNLLMLEFLAKEKMKVSGVLKALDGKYGPFEYDRIDVRFREKDRRKIIAAADSLEKKGELAGKKIVSVNRLDGTKYVIAPNEWVLFRFSGTEPLLRVYSEAPTAERVQENLKFGAALVDQRL
jgi:phosphomannomutase